MNTPLADIYQYIVHPETIGIRSIEVLEKLIKQYPYSPTLRTLYLKALVNVRSTRIKEEIQRTAIYVPDRQHLFYLLNRDTESDFAWVELAKLIKTKKEKNIDIHSNEEDNFILIDHYLEQQHIPASAYKNHVLNSDQILVYDPTIDLTQLDDNEELETNSVTEGNIDFLIDNFIEAEKSGKLFVPSSSSNKNEISEDNAEIDIRKIKETAFLTESLAKVFIRQHKYEQALAILQDLNLRYPKKMCYFADQIRYLEKIIAYKNGKNCTEVHSTQT